MEKWNAKYACWKKNGGKNKEKLCTFLIMQYTNFIQICTEK